MVQRAYGCLAKGGSTIGVKSLRTLRWDTHRFLRSEAWLQFKGGDVQGTSPSKAKTPAPDPAAELEAAKVVKDRFIAAFMADPDNSEKDKQAKRKEWLAAEAHTGRRPPWEPAEPAPAAPARKRRPAPEAGRAAL